MREIPGYYYDAERNRYFKISNRPLPSTFVTGPSSTNTTNTTTTTPVNYSYDKETINRMKLEQVQINKKKKLTKQFRQSQYLHLPGYGLKQQLVVNQSGLETFLTARSHLPPNLIKSSYSLRFIKPYLGEKLTKSGGFQLNQSLYHSHVMSGRLVLGSKQGNLKVLDLESPVSNLNSNSNCITGFKEIINQNLPDNDIKEVKVLSRNLYSYMTLGTGLVSGKIVILKNSNTDLGYLENWNFKSKSSLFCFEASRNTLVAGGEHSLWLLRDWEHTNNQTMTKLVSPSDVLSVCLDSKQGTMFHAGCRNGGVLTYDTRCRKLNPSKKDTVSSKPIYKIIKHSDNYLLGAGLNGFVFQLDLRFKKSVVQSFPGLSNSYDTSLGFTFSQSLNTLFAAGDDNSIKMWSLDSGLGITPPFKKYIHPIHHLHFIENPPHPSQEIVFHPPSSSLLSKGCLLLGNEADWECWSL